VLAVSTLAMGLGAGPTYLVGYLGAELRADLGASGAQLGLLVGLFYGATGVVSLLAAPVVDALGARRCVVGDQVLVTVCLVAAAATGRLAVLAAASALAGAGYAFANAGTSMAVTAVSPRNQAGAAVAVKTAGIPAAATVLALAGPPLASLVGWQGVCLLLAAGTAGTAAAALLVLPDARPQRAGTRRTAGPPLPRGFVWVVLAATCFVVGNQPLSSFLVLTLVDGGTSPVAAGLVSATGTGAGAVAMVLAARRGDRSGPHRRAATAAGVGTVILTGTVLLWTGTHVGLPLVVAGAVLGLVGAMVGAGFSHAVAVDRAPLSVGRATAVMSCGYYLGALAAPLLFGTLADRTGDYDASWAVTVVAAGSSVTFFVVVQLRVRPPVAEPVRRPAPPPSSPRP
jgi:CP family cyanate transporter-like MFS transporter